jgi:hypothetical protein
LAATRFELEACLSRIKLPPFEETTPVTRRIIARMGPILREARTISFEDSGISEVPLEL